MIFLCLLFCADDLSTEECDGIEITSYQWIDANLFYNLVVDVL